ncbi:hypothetical protein JOJ86_000600 [Rhodococcus percolatus]|nr:hypothetical protein [Rhodococcus opacus]MBP2202874.1 hypothetical protein [Rhodococcus opacus]
MVASRTSFPRTCPARPSSWAARASARGYTELTVGRTLPSATSREILVSVSAFGSTLKYRVRLPRRSASALTSSGTSAGRATRTRLASTRRGTAVGLCRRPCRSRHAPAPPTSRTAARGSRRTRQRRASSRTPGWNRTRLRQQRCRRPTGDDRQIATAERLADEGAHLWAVDRDARLLADLVYLVVAPDRTNVVPALLAGLSSGRREHPCPGGVKIAKTRSVIALRMRPPLADCSSRLCFGAALIAAARIASARTVTASSPDVEPLLGASVISSLFKCSAVV